MKKALVFTIFALLAVMCVAQQDVSQPLIDHGTVIKGWNTPTDHDTITVTNFNATETTKKAENNPRITVPMGAWQMLNGRWLSKSFNDPASAELHETCRAAAVAIQLLQDKYPKRAFQLVCDETVWPTFDFSSPITVTVPPVNHNKETYTLVLSDKDKLLGRKIHNLAYQANLAEGDWQSTIAREYFLPSGVFMCGVSYSVEYGSVEKDPRFIVEIDGTAPHESATCDDYLHKLRDRILTGHEWAVTQNGWISEGARLRRSADGTIEVTYPRQNITEEGKNK
jgi:hypothetical protein